MKKTILLLILLATFSHTTIYAWGKSGHRIIAQIAEQNLSRKSYKKIKKLLNGYPMAYSSDWADQIRSDTTGIWKHTYVWHYINIPSDLDRLEFQEAIEAVKQENVYSEIPKLEAILRNKKASTEDRRIALNFIIHLVGDLHQPMHIGREEDLGGNRITVKWFRENTNIHAIWDSNLIDFEQYSYIEYASILGNISKSQQKLIQEGNLSDWLFETYRLTNEIYSSVQSGDELSYGYSYKYKHIVELQLQRAGIRLALILNSCF